MFESAINPAYWWGATAISSPILIHLINRLRFRRIRWAAMEFLLKAQQRNRRRLIIEQLVLLALRCLIVLLVVAFLVRPQWLLGESSHAKAELPTFHVVILDDSLSTQDSEDGVPGRKTAFRNATELVGTIATDAQAARSAHYFTVLRLSAPEVPVVGRPHAQLAGAPPGVQLTEDELAKLRSSMESLEPTYFRLKHEDLAQALDEARQYFGSAAEGNRVLHLLSDFRSRDWTSSEINHVWVKVESMMREQNVLYRPYDVSRPLRSNQRGERPAYHPNVAITNLTARAKDRTGGSASGAGEVPVQVVTHGVPFVLAATLRNFSTDPVRLRLGVRVDGEEKVEFSSIVDLGPHDERIANIDFRFHKTESTVGRKRIAVEASILNEPGRPEQRDHLPVDNSRYLTLELREDVPVLLIDPDHERRLDHNAALRVGSVLRGTNLGLRTVTMRPRMVAEDHVRLDDYAVVYVLNIAGIGDGESDLPADALRKLENYVHGGGSVVFFLGERTNVVQFNENVYRNGEGIFPVPLSARPEPEKGSGLPFVDDVPDLEDFAPKLRFLRDRDPIFQFGGDVLELVTRGIVVNRYFRVDQAHPSWNVQKERVVELVQLANRRPLQQYVTPTLEIVADLQRAAGGGEFAAKVRQYAQAMNDHVSGAQQKRARKGPLLDALAGVLNDPVLAEFWKLPANKELRGRVEKYYDLLRTGDPLVLESRHGPGNRKGTVVTFLTTAGPVPTGDILGTSWNNMADFLGFYPIVFLFGHQYLAGEAMKAKSAETNLLMEKQTILRLNKEKYNDKIEVYFPSGDKLEKLATVTGKEDGDDYVFAIAPQRGPGNYVLRLNVAVEGSAAKGETEERVFSVNVDAAAEGDLARPSDEDIAKAAERALQEGGASVSSAELAAFTNRIQLLSAPAAMQEEIAQAKSWSDFSWVLLLFLSIMLLEQFLAMLFSHHVSDAQGAVPVRLGRVPVMAGNVEVETVSAS